MADKPLLDMTPWLERISRARTQKQMYEILDEYRPLDWNDDQRSTMAKLYMRLIEKLPEN